MDYGHALEFGAFITPAAANPQAPVLLSQAAEASGLDLVTFQDHPYQPAFLDTWTLMSFIAARTERVRIAPNVLNIPLRPPSVVARSAASLDLLSGGRFDLALGAGGFWDAIEAMGGTRLSPGQAVTALEEAIDVIRELWDTSERRGVFTDGRHHRVHGAKRGPRAAHHIPIWIGAYKPRMLSLTGRKGDGWLPSLGYMQPGDLAKGNATIDEAAASVGRDPREIRRLLNVGQLAADPAEFADRLVRLALDEGIGTFILSGDDPRLLQSFGEDVAPLVREIVAGARAERGTAQAAVRSSAALAARREGIAYDDVPAGLRAIEPGDFEYPDVRATYMRGGAPGVVLQPASTEQVVEALAFARRHPELPLALRSGGHGVSGRSTNDGGIVIDLRHLSDIEVIDPERRLVRIGAGARWMQVAAALGEYGWALTSGDYGGVGVGGLATAGGIGFLAREHGLTIDHLRAVELVLADGSVVRADADDNADLFWAVRGAGANVGIVTSFEFEVDEVRRDRLGAARVRGRRPRAIPRGVRPDDGGLAARRDALPPDRRPLAGAAADRAAVRSRRLRRSRHDHLPPAALRRARPTGGPVGAAGHLRASDVQRRPRSPARPRRTALAVGAHRPRHSAIRRRGRTDAGIRRGILLPAAGRGGRGRRRAGRRDGVLAPVCELLGGRAGSGSGETRRGLARGRRARRRDVSELRFLTAP